MYAEVCFETPSISWDFRKFSMPLILGRRLGSLGDFPWATLADFSVVATELDRQLSSVAVMGNMIESAMQELSELVLPPPSQVWIDNWQSCRMEERHMPSFPSPKLLEKHPLRELMGRFSN